MNTLTDSWVELCDRNTHTVTSTDGDWNTDTTSSLYTADSGDYKVIEEKYYIGSDTYSISYDLVSDMSDTETPEIKCNVFVKNMSDDFVTYIKGVKIETL